MKKKLLSMVLAAALALSMTACSSGSGSTGGGDKAAAADGEWKWERNIEIICPWGTGGGADTTLRQFATALEKEIGVKVVVNNKAGAGGVTGVQFAAQQPADGYTYLLCTPSPLLAQISGATDYDVYGTIHPLVQLVHDCNVFVTGKNSPYNNYEELKAYVDANPGKVKCGVMTITGLDAACVEAGFEGSVEAVAYTEGSQLNADVIGGHVDLACVGPAEVSAMVASGDMKVIMSCTEEPLTMAGYENVESAGKLGLDCFFGPARGIFYTEGTPEAALKAFEAAAEKAVASEDFQNWAKGEGLDQRQGWMNTADFTTAWDNDYKDLTELFGAAK
ncbi:MAG: tripartite tricarboxylate transporter substrate binding protein [Lachnospiraceae bacterium]|nr:tripartite tricarboxylate transporter substrate binding protein [Lachnospiraceae bacterium]